MNNLEADKRISEELKRIATEYDVAIITARQLPRRGYTPPLPRDPNKIIIDYTGILR